MKVPSMTGWTRAQYLDFCDEVRSTLHEAGNAALRRMVLDEAGKMWQREQGRKAIQAQRAEDRGASLLGSAVRA